MMVVLLFSNTRGNGKHDKPTKDIFQLLELLIVLDVQRKCGVHEPWLIRLLTTTGTFVLYRPQNCDITPSTRSLGHESRVREELTLGT